EDTDLAAGLDGERSLDAVEALRDGLQVLESLDVRVHGLAARARPGRADRVGDLDDRRLETGVLDLLVMRGDAVDHLERQVVPLRDLGTDGRVRPLDLVVDRLADVVEQTAHLGDLDVGAALRRDDGREVARLDHVIEHVLAVARAVLESAEELDDLRRQPRDPGLVSGLLAGLPDDEVDFGTCLGDDFLDPTGMDAPISDELRDRDPGDLATNRVETTQDDRLRGVVDDQVDAGGLFEGADVATLPADDPALHLVGWQVDHTDGVLRRVV